MAELGGQVVHLQQNPKPKSLCVEKSMCRKVMSRWKDVSLEIITHRAKTIESVSFALLSHASNICLCTNTEQWYVQLENESLGGSARPAPVQTTSRTSLPLFKTWPYSSTNTDKSPQDRPLPWLMWHKVDAQIFTHVRLSTCRLL